MRNYWLRKILAVPLILLVASFLIFWAVRLLPGDPARLMAGMQADQKIVIAVRSRLGLDKPFAIQYEIFLRNILHGDLGMSIRSHKPVAEEIAERFPYTLALDNRKFCPRGWRGHHGRDFRGYLQRPHTGSSRHGRRRFQGRPLPTSGWRCWP